MHRGVDDRQCRRGRDIAAGHDIAAGSDTAAGSDAAFGSNRARNGSGAAHILVEHAVVGGLKGIGTGQLQHVGLGRNAVDLGRNFSVNGGDNLGTVVGATEVHLVAVIARRVVAGGDHHAGTGIEVTHGESEHGGGEHPGQQDGANPGPGHDLRRVAGKDFGVDPAVVADHDAGPGGSGSGSGRCTGRRAGSSDGSCVGSHVGSHSGSGVALEQEVGESGRRLAHQHAVHAV